MISHCFGFSAKKKEDLLFCKTDGAGASIIPKHGQNKCVRTNDKENIKEVGGGSLCDGTPGRKGRTHPEMEGREEKNISRAQIFIRLLWTLTRKNMKKKRRKKSGGKKPPHGNGNAYGTPEPLPLVMAFFFYFFIFLCWG